MSLTLLESRIKDSVPEEYHDDVEREVSRFQSEIHRLSEREDKIGQATLTQREIEMAPTANQFCEEGFTTIELQCIKAAAIKYKVNDWVHRIEKSLSYEENIEKMKSSGERRDMRELSHIR